MTTRNLASTIYKIRNGVLQDAAQDTTTTVKTRASRLLVATKRVIINVLKTKYRPIEWTVIKFYQTKNISNTKFLQISNKHKNASKTKIQVTKQKAKTKSRSSLRTL